MPRIQKNTYALPQNLWVKRAKTRLELYYQAKDIPTHIHRPRIYKYDGWEYGPYSIYVHPLALSKEVAYTPRELQHLYNTLLAVSEQIWGNFEPRAWSHHSADYSVYVDKVLQAEGSLSLSPEGVLHFKAAPQPFKNDEVCLYRFDKRRMEAFLHDLHALLSTLHYNASL